MWIKRRIYIHIYFSRFEGEKKKNTVRKGVNELIKEKKKKKSNSISCEPIASSMFRIIMCKLKRV